MSSDFYHLAGPLFAELIWPPAPDDRIVHDNSVDPEDLREHWCIDCGGDREFEVITGYDHRDGEPTGYMVTCRGCGGVGGGWYECPLIEEEDIEDWIGDGFPEVRG